MKILQIINSLGTGGAEKLLLDTIPLYRKKGIHVDILVIWDSDHVFLERLKELNCCKIHILTKSSNYKDIYNPSHIFKIKRILKHYDIAHVHLFPAQYFTVFANQLNGNKTKLVFTEHSTSNSRIKNAWYKPIERYIYKRYQRLICISEEVDAIYRKYLNGIVKQVVIHNGVNIERIFNAKRLAENRFLPYHQNGQRIILQVSAFRHGKDQKTLIDALKIMGKGYTVVFAGAGETESALKTYVTQQNLNNNVVFLGQRMDIPELLKSVDFVVLSSHYEGLSLASIEGLASGSPFIASDVPGLRDVVRGAGILFENGNAKELASIILRLSDNQELSRRITDRCIARARGYDIHLMVQKHIDLYDRLHTDT